MKRAAHIATAFFVLLSLAAGCAYNGRLTSARPFLKPRLKAGEVYEYKLTTTSGAEGKAVFRVDRDKRRPYGFVLTNTGAIPSLLDSVAVSRLKPDLHPISTDVTIKNPGGVFALSAAYLENKLLIKRGGQPDISVDIAEDTYDFGEFLTLLRSLNFKVGAKYTVHEAWPSFGQVFKSRIAVTGVETIRVPAGAFRAYHVTHTFGEATDGKQAVYHSWYEESPPHRLVKHNTGSILYELLPSRRRTSQRF